MIGASACVMGIVALAALLYPRRIVQLLIFFVMPVPIPLWLLATVFIEMDLLYVLRGIDTGVASLAHLGGAVWGVLYWLRTERQVGPSIDWPSWQRFRLRRRLKLVKPDLHEEGPDPDVRAEVDRLLDKIATGGIDSLTGAERDYLTRASRDFRHK